MKKEEIKVRKNVKFAFVGGAEKWQGVGCVFSASKRMLSDVSLRERTSHLVR